MPQQQASIRHFCGAQEHSQQSHQTRKSRHPHRLAPAPAQADDADDAHQILTRQGETPSC